MCACSWAPIFGYDVSGVSGAFVPVLEEEERGIKVRFAIRHRPSTDLITFPLLYAAGGVDVLLDVSGLEGHLERRAAQAVRRTIAQELST